MNAALFSTTPYRARVGRSLPVLALAGALALSSSACAPRGAHPELVMARVEYTRAQADPMVRQSAPAQLEYADRVLHRAEEIWEKGGDSHEVGELASVGRSQVQVAQSMAAYEKARLEAEATRRRLIALRRIEAMNEEPVVQSEPAASPVEVHAYSAPDGSVEGTLVNSSSRPIEDVKVMVNHAWLWNNEFRPGAVSPSRVEYFRVAEKIPPGGQVSFAHRPTTPLPASGEGHFETSLKVVSFEEVHEIGR